MATVLAAPYRMDWDPKRMSWVLWCGRWEQIAIHGFLPGRPQMTERMAVEFFESILGPLREQATT